MEYLFRKDIYDWNSWGEVYQSISDFQELIKAIFIKENLSGYEQISNLTPGTNAVFKVGNYVIKIFAPKESGANTDIDYNAEMSSIKSAITGGINTPRVITASYIEDRYVFRYFIMDYIDGQEAGNVLKSYSSHQKLNFVHKLKENLYKLNTIPIEQVNPDSIKKRAINNIRWDKYTDAIKAQISDILMSHNLSPLTYVHGDITADNVMVDVNEDLFIIDFADSTIAPIEYEYPPIIFDLFDFDQEMIHEFMKGIDYDVFIEKLFVSTLLHEFGAFFVKDIYKKCTGNDIDELTDIYEIKRLIYSKFLIST